MRNAPLIVVAALAAIILALAGPAQAHDRWPPVPAEAGVHPLAGVGWLPYRCDDGPVFNLYHGAY